MNEDSGKDAAEGGGHQVLSSQMGTVALADRGWPDTCCVAPSLCMVSA
jgi:hypothetical protein